MIKILIKTIFLNLIFVNLFKFETVKSNLEKSMSFFIYNIYKKESIYEIYLAYAIYIDMVLPDWALGHLICHSNISVRRLAASHPFHNAADHSGLSVLSLSSEDVHEHLVAMQLFSINIKLNNSMNNKKFKKMYITLNLISFFKKNILLLTRPQKNK